MTSQQLEDVFIVLFSGLCFASLWRYELSLLSIFIYAEPMLHHD
jgi:hypothetical protein